MLSAMLQNPASFLENKNIMNVAMIAHSLGLMDVGSKHTWELIEQVVIQFFDKLNEADFDMFLSGFCSGSLPKGSMNLRRHFTVCTLSNYASDPDAFIKAANYLGKDL